MKSQSGEGEIDFWCERGVPTQEIISRIHERSDLECRTAYQWLHNWVGRDTMIKVCQMADGLRSVKRVMAIMQPLFEREQHGGKPTGLVIELSALAVEAAVRQGKKLFPAEN